MGGSIKDHHEGYIDWAEFERNQEQLAANAYGRAGDAKSDAADGRCWPVCICCAAAGGGLMRSYTPGRPSGTAGLPVRQPNLHARGCRDA